MKYCSPWAEQQTFELMLEQARTELLLGLAWTLDELPTEP
jgi:hypothetical protein